jgi:hypothetical protein
MRHGCFFVGMYSVQKKSDPNLSRYNVWKTYFSLVFTCGQVTNYNHRNTKTFEVDGSPTLLLQSCGTICTRGNMSLMGVANKNNQELVLFCCHPQYFLKSLAGRTYPSTFQPRSNFHPHHHQLSCSCSPSRRENGKLCSKDEAIVQD